MLKGVRVNVNSALSFNILEIWKLQLIRLYYRYLIF